MEATRRTATFVWAAMLVVPIAFLSVAFTIEPEHEAPGLAGPLLWTAVLVSVANVALAWVLPPRLGPARAHDRDAVAFTRAVVSLALCEAAALAPVVAYMITRDPRLLAVLAADVGAILAFYPSGLRWDALRPLGDSDGLPRAHAEGVARKREEP